MEMALPLLLILVAVAGYVVLRMWLPSVAKKDMDRRGQPGWAYDMAVWWVLPIGLFAWWQARRRYPILEDETDARRSARRGESGH